jgi:NAD(P)-dependent dehydrogenase (short-subunit alcohol dehydrogenase family)
VKKAYSKLSRIDHEDSHKGMHEYYLSRHSVSHDRIGVIKVVCLRGSHSSCSLFLIMSSLRANLPDYENPLRPSRSLKGKVAIVTGAGSRSAVIGNGRAAAILLAEAGAFVVCADINVEWAKMTVSMIEEEFGTGVAVEVEADVVKEADCKRVVATAIEKYGHLDILVNNVGVAGPQGTAVDVEPTEWAEGLEINVSSMMQMVKYAVPEMEKNSLDSIFGRGCIVNIASVAGLLGGTPMLLYHTSKGAVVNMTRAMAVHHGAMGIRVNCVCPGMLSFICNTSLQLLIIK